MYHQLSLPGSFGCREEEEEVVDDDPFRARRSFHSKAAEHAPSKYREEDIFLSKPRMYHQLTLVLIPKESSSSTWPSSQEGGEDRQTIIEERRRIFIYTRSQSHKYRHRLRLICRNWISEKKRSSRRPLSEEEAVVGFSVEELAVASWGLF